MRLAAIACAALGLVCVMSSGSVGAQTSPADSEAVRRAIASVVSVLPVWPRGDRRNEEPEGSGVVIGDGHRVLTADHVLGPAKDVFVRTAEGHVQRGTIAGRDAATDLALVTVDTALPAAILSGPAVVAEPVCAIGNSFGLDLSVTCGHVSAIERSGVGFNAIEDFVQTDAAVNPGMSGGALVNMKGHVVGILSAIFTKTADANIGVNFAVSVRLASRVAEQLSDTGKATWASPGLRLGRHPSLGSEGREGLAVLGIMPGSPADVAGLETGDILYEAAGRRLRRPGEYLAALALRPIDAPFEVAGARNGKEMQFSIAYDRAKD